MTARGRLASHSTKGWRTGGQGIRLGWSHLQPPAEQAVHGQQHLGAQGQAQKCGNHNGPRLARRCRCGHGCCVPLLLHKFTTSMARHAVLMQITRLSCAAAQGEGPRRSRVVQAAAAAAAAERRRWRRLWRLGSGASANDSVHFL